MNNYRPISLICNFCKILEKIVFNRLTFFLNEKNLITTDQFGFRKGHSTIHPMTQILNAAAKTLNNKKHMLIIFCDLKKAFDTCNFKILLSKLQKLGITGNELSWFESYLTNRKQYVCLEECNSALLSILIGVPQGSILGPLLFLLYINDLPQTSNPSTKLFADDTALFADDDDIQNLLTFVNEEFQKICQYFRKNKLSLHPDKTKYMIISNSKNVQTLKTSIYINNNNLNQNDQLLVRELSRVNTTDKIPAIKYLGVYFDPQLNFKYHINTISSKIAKSLYILRNAKNFLPPAALKTLYYSLIHCHLIYAAEIWGCAAPFSLSPLRLKQKSAIRLISSSKYNAHTGPLFLANKILPLFSLIEAQKAKFMHSHTYETLPSSLLNTWTKNRNRQEQLLRNEDDYDIPFARTDATSLLPLSSFPRIWNALPTEVSSTRSKNVFSNSLYSHYLNILLLSPPCTRLLCPVCHLQQLN